MSSAAFMLVLPGTAVVLISSRFNSCRAFSDRTLTLTRAAAVPPKLMVFSRENPRSCSFFNLSRSIKDGIDQSFLNFDREVEIPEAVASDKNLCVGSSEGIVFSQNRTQLLAFDPLTAAPFPLPPNSTLEPYPRPEGSHYDECRFVEGKIILSPSRDMLVRQRNLDLDVARPGDDGWTDLDNCFGFGHELTFHKGLLHCLANLGCVGVYGFKNGSLSEPHISVFKDYVLERKSHTYFFRNFLVESPDGKELFLVYRQREIESPRTEYFKVFKLNEEGKWKRVKKIGDMAIFVGINQSVSLRASTFPHILKPNSIYFTESHHTLCSYVPRPPRVRLGVRGTGVYTLNDRSIQFLELTKGQEVLDWPDWPPAVWYIPPITL